MLHVSGIGQGLIGVGITVFAYTAALYARTRWKFVHPLAASLAVIAFLRFSGISYEDYRIGGDWIAWGLGPATVGLAVPLYKNAGLIKQKLVPVLAGITAGSLVSLLVTPLLLILMGSPKAIVLSMLSKSVTAPISMEISERVGGSAELGAVFSVLTGLLGSLAGPAFLRLCGIRGDFPVGTAIGTSSHGIGTARLMSESELRGGISGFSMAAAGIVTSLLMIPVYWWL